MSFLNVIINKNEKWRNSSVMPKIAMWMMLICSLMFLISAFILMSWDRMLASLSESRGSGIWLPFLFFFLFTLILAFGLFKINNFARVLTIFWGLGSVIMVILLVAGAGYLLSYAKAAVGDAAVDAAVDSYKASAGLAGSLFKNIIIPLIPKSVLASIGFYLFIFTFTPVLIVLSMFVLLFCKKDFKRKIES
ncbi:MAG: hypothetical protein FWC22_01015 [Treponema sp.]|nr:hypothetical protein [Treponema sp.]